MPDDFFDNLTSLTDNLKDIAFSRYATITQINNDNTINCKDDEGTIHINATNSTNLNLSVDDRILLGFINNDIYNPMVLGGVDVKNADDTLIYALGLGKFHINEDGDLMLDLPIGVENYFELNEDGDLIVDLGDPELEQHFSMNEEGDVIYDP